MSSPSLSSSSEMALPQEARLWWPKRGKQNNEGDEENAADNGKKRRRRLMIMFMRLWKLKKRERGSESSKQDNLAPPKLVDRLLGKLKDELHQHLHPHHPPPPPATPAPAPAPAPEVKQQHHEEQQMYPHASQLFGEVPNTAAPNPSHLWSEELRSAPKPTNSFWLNYVLNEGSQPEYIHPYLVQSKPGSFTVCYPARIVSSAFIIQAFTQDLTIAHGRGSAPHVVSHYDDLSVTLEVPGKRLKVPLVRGSPYVTLVFKGLQAASDPLVVSTVHAVLDLCSSADGRKHRVVLNNGQTWVLYATSGFDLRKEGTSRLVSSSSFSGVLRVAVVPSPEHERVLDAFSGRYPVRGHATFDDQFSVGFQWKSRGHGDDLLMLCLPMHRQIMASPCSAACRIPELTFSSIDGPLEGILGDRWILREQQPISAGWYSSRGISDLASKDRIRQALEREVAELQPIATSSAYFYGKAAARAARMALIAEEIGHYSVIEKIRCFLVDSLTPWLDGSFPSNGIVFDAKWGGLVSRVGARDSGADFGNGCYNDHHYHWGYFVYAGAVLAKLDNAWARAFRPHLYALLADYMALRSTDSSSFPRLRCFDLWLLHSWAGGLVEFADGRNQESTSEAVNAYYAAVLLGMAYGDVGTINHGLTLAALEVRAAKALWHIRSSASIYEAEFSRDNRLIGVLWANKRDTGLWFAAAESRECRLGIQVLPITPVTESLFDDLGFAREVVDWARPRLNAEGVTDGWKGFVYAVQAVCGGGEREEALRCTLALQGHDDGNSLSNMLWWILSR